MNYTKGRNLFIQSSAQDGYLNATTLAISPMNAINRESTSDFIPVDGMESVTIQSWVPSIGEKQQTWIGYAFYSDKTLESYIKPRTAKHGTAGSTYLSYENVAVPEGANYLIVSFRRLSDGYCKVEYGPEATAWRPAPEDVIDSETGGGGINDPRP